MPGSGAVRSAEAHEVRGPPPVRTSGHAAEMAYEGPTRNPANFQRVSLLTPSRPWYTRVLSTKARKRGKLPRRRPDSRRCEMRRRLLESLGVAAVLMALGMLLQASAVSVAAQAPAGRATAGTGRAPKTAWGHPDLQGIWLDEFDTPLERPAQYANREFLTDQERAVLDRAGGAKPEGDDRTYSAAVHLGEADGPTDVTGRRSGKRPNPRAHAAGPGAEPARTRVPYGPPSEHRRRASRQLEGCNGGQYGPPSPRFAEVAPFYNTVRMNRHNGPEDQSARGPVHGGSDAGLQRVPPHRAGAGLHRDRRRHRAGPGIPAQLSI